MFVRLTLECTLGSRIRGLVGLIAGLVTGAMLDAAVYRAGEWPLEVTVVADQSTISLGEPAWLSFSVTNLSDEALQILVGGDYQNELGRPASFVVRAVGKDGKWVDVPDAGLGAGGLVGPQDLPARGHYEFRLFVPHWATFKEAGNYTLICRRTLQVLRPVPGVPFARQPTTDVPVEVRTTLTVLPRDVGRLKSRIAELGEQMLAAAGEKSGDESVIGLSWIDDPQVVPYFVRALSIRSYALKFIALQMLARFPTDEALAGLKTALNTTAAAFDYVEREQAEELAAKIRAAAVGALSRNRHPGAQELALLQRRDSADRVRLAVLRVVARLAPARALPLLEEFAKDPSPEVREAAQRYSAVVRQSSQQAVTK